MARARPTREQAAERDAARLAEVAMRTMLDAHEAKLIGIREVTAAETFRVFSESSCAEHIGEFVVTVDRTGITIRESWEEPELARDLSWHYVNEVAGRANETVRDIERDIEAITNELRAWEQIRDGEAHRILRARAIQRIQTVLTLCDRARTVLGVWQRPRPKPRAWRDLVRRWNG